MIWIGFFACCDLLCLSLYLRLEFESLMDCASIIIFTKYLLKKFNCVISQLPEVQLTSKGRSITRLINLAYKGLIIALDMWRNAIPRGYQCFPVRFGIAKNLIYYRATVLLFINWRFNGFSNNAHIKLSLFEKVGFSTVRFMTSDIQFGTVLIANMC